jgi:hypothetical protein
MGRGEGEERFQIFLVKCQIETSVRDEINVPKVKNLIKGV